MVLDRVKWVTLIVTTAAIISMLTLLLKPTFNQYIVDTNANNSCNDINYNTYQLKNEVMNNNTKTNNNDNKHDTFNADVSGFRRHCLDQLLNFCCLRRHSDTFFSC